MHRTTGFAAQRNLGNQGVKGKKLGIKIFKKKTHQAPMGPILRERTRTLEKPKRTRVKESGPKSREFT
jgi:hypothetical protein